ncbi:hypothetical protein AXG93_1040s1070 [Marchantia polymorpha subsp. ruderalis]|uniref:Uncharacterized protein n=1 Tax=Marchantia polymorpha subsp. ruderalis TaxID=1480154 RepID=A0A176VG65_MARPO|nr:hypothetical protein AXG93_1040s1070 [Marchantia polymorpha subsp. ruderalis]
MSAPERAAHWPQPATPVKLLQADTGGQTYQHAKNLERHVVENTRQLSTRWSRRGERTVSQAFPKPASASDRGMNKHQQTGPAPDRRLRAIGVGKGPELQPQTRCALAEGSTTSRSAAAARSNKLSPAMEEAY